MFMTRGMRIDIGFPAYFFVIIFFTLNNPIMNHSVTEKANNKSIKTPKNVLDGILPFTEKPANENEKKAYDHDEQHAYELFSHFTANIIKKDAAFVR